MRYEEIAGKLWGMLPAEDRERILRQDGCELERDFLGFVDTYYHLSMLIPKDWTVIDFGAAFNPQCYFFQGHKRYLAVQPCDGVGEMFQTENCDIYRCTTGEFIEKELGELGLDLDKVFAICNYVPPWYNEDSRDLVRQNFKNVYVFYP